MIMQGCVWMPLFQGGKALVRNMGQICIAVNRIYVDFEIYEEFVERFAKATEKLVIGTV